METNDPSTSGEIPPLDEPISSREGQKNFGLPDHQEELMQLLRTLESKVQAWEGKKGSSRYHPYKGRGGRGKGPRGRGGRMN